MSNKSQNNISTILMFTDIVGVVTIIINDEYNPLADVNCDEQVNVVDIVSIVAIIISF